MIYDYSREKESLNGSWYFQVDWYDSCLRNRWFAEEKEDGAGRPIPVDYDFESWEKAPVPGCWNMLDPRYYYYEGPAVYTRTFSYYARGEERVFIRFGAANYEAKIFLNRQYLGFHQGGSTPFFVEVTGLLAGTNRLLVVVDDTRKTTAVPCRNTDWFNYGGLYRDVELIRLPETFIKDFTIQLVPRSDFSRIAMTLAVDGRHNTGEARLRIDLLGVDQKIPVKDGVGELTITARPELWSPEHPYLYDLTLTYQSDSIRDRVGFREIIVAGTDILLNGKKIFLKGVCSHEESVKNGKAVIGAEIRENIRLAKELNCNFMRLAHYPHTEQAARLADELGLLLWEEIPVYWAIAFSNPSTYADAENQLCELIKRDRNRASVIIWSVGNENADTDARFTFMSKLARKAKESDPGRLVSAACLVNHERLLIDDRLVSFLDVIGLNEYYGWYDPDFTKLPKIFENSRPTKPVIISEFGADALAGTEGTVNDLGTEACQLAIYQQQVAIFDKLPCLNGTAPWILFDFRCPRRANARQQGYNTKGLLSQEKSYKKPAFYVMQEFYSRK